MSSYRCLITVMFVLMIVGCSGLAWAAPDPIGWMFESGHLPPGMAAGSAYGAYPNATDGYDVSDRIALSLPGPGAAAMYIYHESGPAWSGPTGFYNEDVHAPLVGHPFTTWSNIYLWAYDSWDYGHTITYVFAPYTPIPAHYGARLYLDYVPQAAGWTGPMWFDISPTQGTWVELPIVAVSNPLDGVRMHFTVMAPEPSSVLTLGLPMIGMASMLLRRRRR